MEMAKLTICKAASIMIYQTLPEEDEQMWCNVKILIIDEISFTSKAQSQKLDKRLKQMRNKTKLFGGFSIIYAEEF